MRVTERVRTIDLGGGTLASSGFEDIFVAKLDANGNHMWSRRFGDGQEQYTEALDTDANGNVVVTGEMYGTVDFGGGGLASAGGRDIFLAKLDASGNHLWSKRFGDASEQYAYGVAVDGSGNVIITGRLDGSASFGGATLTSAGSGDLFVAKFASNGTHLWSKRFGDANFQSGMSVATDLMGNILVTGLAGGAVDFGLGALMTACSTGIFVAKFDPNGNALWGKLFAPGCGSGKAVVVDGSNSPILTGDFMSNVDFGGGLLTKVTNRDVFLAKFAQ